MIQKVHAKNFKAQTFSDEIGRRNLFVGDNGSGKSARTDALMLSLYGSLANGPKRQADIIGGYTDTDSLFVGCEIDGHTFARKMKKTPAGATKQTYYIDKRPVSKSGYMEALEDAGGPKVIDVGKFMGLSEQMKIGTIFTMFPPKADVGKIDAKLKQAKDDLNATVANIRDKNKIIEQLSLTRQADFKPTCTLAETTAKIQSIAAQIKEVSDAIAAQKIADAAANAKQQVQAEIDKQQAESEKLRLEAAAKRKKLAEIRAKKQAENPCTPIKLCIFDDVCSGDCFVKKHCMNQKCFKGE